MSSVRFFSNSQLSDKRPVYSFSDFENINRVNIMSESSFADPGIAPADPAFLDFSPDIDFEDLAPPHNYGGLSPFHETQTEEEEVEGVGRLNMGQIV